MLSKIKSTLRVIFLNFIFRYFKISAVCATIEYVAFITLFIYFKLGLFTSYSLSFFFAFIIGLFGHAYFTFKLARLLVLNIFLFIIQCAISLFVGYNLVNFFLQLDLNPFFSKGFQLAITFIFNITFARFITFKNP
jgi:hypothetical protein